MWLLLGLGFLLQQPPLAIAYDPATAGPVVQVGPVLYGDELEDGARSGLPIRVRVRVEPRKIPQLDKLDTYAGSV